MRFMVIVKASQNSEAGIMPSPELLGAMGKFNEELMKAGVMLAGEGLQASSKGARVKFAGDKRIVTDGPFAEMREQLGGFFMINAANLDEAIEIAGRIPDYLDPLDGPAWERAILEYSKKRSAARMSQLGRMKDFNPPTWRRHFAAVDSWLVGLSTNEAAQSRAANPSTRLETADSLASPPRTRHRSTSTRRKSL